MVVPPGCWPQVCDYWGWQSPFVVLVALLVAVPLALPGVAAWSRAEHGNPGSPRHAVRLGVRRALVDPYRDGVFWWEAVLMAQRLVSPVSLPLFQISWVARRPRNTQWVILYLLGYTGSV